MTQHNRVITEITKKPLHSARWTSIEKGFRCLCPEKHAGLEVLAVRMKGVTWLIAACRKAFRSAGDGDRPGLPGGSVRSRLT